MCVGFDGLEQCVCDSLHMDDCDLGDDFDAGGRFAEGSEYGGGYRHDDVVGAVALVIAFNILVHRAHI